MESRFELSGIKFERRLVSASGIRFHCVIGGSGPTVVLVAGFPQSWYAWRRVMPLLSSGFKVVAVDLPGQGDSDKPSDGYDTQTTARRLNSLLKALNIDKHFLVGHDIGSWVAYPYAHAFEKELNGVVFIDGNIPGVTLQPTIKVADPDYWRSWHFLFNMVDDLPEALFLGRERTLIEWFFSKKTANAISTFDRADIDEYERVYSMLGGMRGMLGYYRAVIQDMEQNKKLFGRKLKLPILALGGDVGSAPGIFQAMQPLGENVSGGLISECGHYIPEEQPAQLVEALKNFFNKYLG
jgi:pimeloyl-ACP methyl ester carboxylesterase